VFGLDSVLDGRITRLVEVLALWSPRLTHQFFIIFNFWAALFCIYILIFMAVSLKRSDSVDGQMIALAAV
jgi:hypothetical protein